jgi:hypothetical protein
VVCRTAAIERAVTWIRVIDQIMFETSSRSHASTELIP